VVTQNHGRGRGDRTQSGTTGMANKKTVISRITIFSLQEVNRSVRKGHHFLGPSRQEVGSENLTLFSWAWVEGCNLWRNYLVLGKNIFLSFLQGAGNKLLRPAQEQPVISVYVVRVQFDLHSFPYALVPTSRLLDDDADIVEQYTMIKIDALFHHS
jgi:hypothetical protein